MCWEKEGKFPAQRLKIVKYWKVGFIAETKTNRVLTTRQQKKSKPRILLLLFIYGLLGFSQILFIMTRSDVLVFASEALSAMFFFSNRPISQLALFNHPSRPPLNNL